MITTVSTLCINELLLTPLNVYQESGLLRSDHAEIGSTVPNRISTDFQFLYVVLRHDTLCTLLLGLIVAGSLFCSSPSCVRPEITLGG